MYAEIISISSHLMRGQDLNRNSAFLTRELVPLGITISHNVSIRNDVEDFKNALKLAKTRSELIIITGGLGPDEDDITKMTLSEYLNVPLVLDNNAEERIITYHQNSELTMPKYNQLQAMILMNSIPLQNVTGLAAGCFYQGEKQAYLLLPGPFDELKPMFIEHARQVILDQLLGNPVVLTKKLSLYGLTLAQLNEKLGDYISYEDNPFVGIYYEEDEAEIQITVRAKTNEDAQKIMNDSVTKIKELVVDYTYSENGDSLGMVVKNLLQEQNKKITAAESLTGGAFLDLITGEPQSSEIIEGGIVTYSEEIKNGVLGVTKKTIEKHGVVSAQCAIEMAEKALKMFGADIAVSLTGVAGPASLESEIPGTVWIGIAEDGKETFAKKFHFGYQRRRNRKNSVLSALNLVRLTLLDEPIDDKVFFDD